MTPRPSRRLALVLPLACLMLLAAGCGGDDGDPDAPGDGPGAEGPERPDDADGVDPEEAAGESRRVLEACRQIVERAPGISDEVKRDLLAECEEAAADDEEAARRAAGAACDAIAAATVPGPLRGPAASACRRAIPGATRL